MVTARHTQIQWPIFVLLRPHGPGHSHPAKGLVRKPIYIDTKMARLKRAYSPYLNEL